MKVGRPVSLHVNGVPYTLPVRSGWTLLELLRDGLRLVGTKEGCDDGTCGTCTVLVDETMVRACRIRAQQMAGRDLLTIEGVGTAGELHPLQEAFLQADAVHCGFCTPGMIMAVLALLKRNPRPGRKEIIQRLGGNLCRCTGYRSVLDAVEWVVAGKHGSPRSWPRGLPSDEWRLGAREKVLGKALYAADIHMGGMLYACALRSPHAHAEILKVDTDRARALPGVEAVLTARDILGKNSYGRVVKDQPVLVEVKVRQVGDPIAVVAAASPETAAQALSLIHVQYRPLPAVFEPAEALADGAPLIHASSNLLAEHELRVGDVEQGLAQADIVVDQCYTTPWNEHAYLEPEAAVAYLEGETMVVQTPTQHPHYHRSEVARTLGWPEERVRVVPAVVGGAFGGKADISCQCLVALLALKTGRLVKMVYTRAESFACTPKRHPFWIRCRTGVTREGELTALHMDMIADTGAYASTGPQRMIRVSASATGPYRWPHVDLHGRVVYTNNPTAGSMRGPGATQVVFALESQMDMMAERLGMDPFELRLKNSLRQGEVLPSGQILTQDPGYTLTLDAVRPYYAEALARSRENRGIPGPKRRGVGIASLWYGIGTGGSRVPGRAALDLLRDGTVVLRTSAVDLGQGCSTALGLIAAEELSLSLAHVKVLAGDTGVASDAGPTTGSRVTYFVGNAVRDAACRLKSAALSTAGMLLKRPVEDLELWGGQVSIRGGPGRGLSLGEIARTREAAGLANSYEGVFDPPTSPPDARTGVGEPYRTYVSATQMVEVEVDARTGQVQVLRVVAAHDVGKPVYPRGVVGQLEGAVVMGVGFALKEEFIPGKTTGFKQYQIPRFKDAPEVISLLVQGTDATGEPQAKGVAECANVAVAPAIVNAIAHATGERVFNLPVKPRACRAERARRAS